MGWMGLVDGVVEDQSAIYQYLSKDNADLKRKRRTFSQEQWSCYASLYVA